MISSMKQPRSTDPNLSLIGTSQRCSGCGTVNTPLWRLGPSGPKSMCNACGIRWKRNSSNPKKKRALLNAKPTDDEDDYITPPPTPERERRRGSLSIEAPGSSPLQHGRVYDERTTTSFYVREVDLNALHSSDGSEVFNSSELSDDEISMIDEDDDFEQEEEEYEERPRKGSPHVSMKRRPEPKKPLKNKKPVAPVTPAAASQPKQELTTPKFDRIDALAIVATSDFKIMEFQAAYNGLLQREAAQSTTIRDLVEQLNEKDRRIRHLERLLCSAPSAVSSFQQSSRSSQISVQSLLSHMN